MYDSEFNVGENVYHFLLKISLFKRRKFVFKDYVY